MNTEEMAVADCWQTVDGGVVELSARHFKTARQSLRWTWESDSRLRRDGLGIDTRQAPGAGMEGWVYREKPLPGHLIFRLGTESALAAGTPAYSFRFGLDFTGWRMFCVLFERDCQPSEDHDTASRKSRGASPDPIIEMLEVLPPAGISKGTIFLDAIEISESVPWNRSADYQIPEHADGLGEYWQHWPLHYMLQLPSEPLPLTISESQKRDFATIFQRYRNWLLGTAIAGGVTPLLQRSAGQTVDYICQGWNAYRTLGLQVDADGWITGPGLQMGRGPNTFHHVFYDILLPLVFDCKLNNNAAAKDSVLLLFDYLHDQGWAEGSANGSLILNCLVFAPYCHAIAMMHDELAATGRLQAAVRTAQWYLSFGKCLSRFDQAYIETNADELRSTVFTALVMILAMPDSPQKVQYMRSWLNWFNAALEISPRFAGVFKPDGIGFHHHGIYASAYATEAYEMSALSVYLLHGTEFAAATASVATLKQAVETQAQISHPYDVPSATQGRMPGLGCRVFSAYAYLALTADPVDTDMAGIFMRLWEPESDYLKGTLSVDLDGAGGKFMCCQTPGRLQLMQELADRGLPAAPPPEGFWSKPWGALAVHRRDNWMMAVKGWSQYVWDFEMHPKLWAMVEENVYARYISYGTLQPFTHGNPINPVDSGWNLNVGWDWCRWSGATTKHLALDELYDPKTSWANRFFSSATFVGGVSCEGHNGMFALKLHEHFHDPTFRAYKTYFFLENEIICLGSNIENRDGDHTTETTLFQCWMPSERMPVQVNGEAISTFPFTFEGKSGQPLTLLDPYGNGYVLPDAGALRLRRDRQYSRDAWNRGESEGAFSTAWLDHGQPPQEDGYGEVRYHYVMLVQTTPEQLAAFADTPNYRVLQQNHQAHIVKYDALGPEARGDARAPGAGNGRTWAYALFETDWIVSHGIVRKTDTPVMIMVKEKGDPLVLSLADPDLRLPKRRNVGYLDDAAARTMAKPSAVRVELRGDWELKSDPPGVAIIERAADRTVLEFACAYGATTEVQLTPQPC